MSVRVITSAADFKALLSAHKIVVADFWATWCAPCKAVAPLFQSLATANIHDKLAFAKIDIDDVGELAQEYGVSSIPTFVLFEDGKPAGEIKGAAPAKLNELVKDALAKAQA
ncbi:hypothetical protein TD95_003871 [Thielaviopsis punctulata]|uniref:Thioredoxin n=1 Tax=Thielaviopsis punctulata TaxID=72032 RepID=A0A0F4ZKA2_9PEZI|nr:hypothetical protein TD95_003871 [Thielaviopsis punctulata]